MTSNYCPRKLSCQMMPGDFKVTGRMLCLYGYGSYTAWCNVDFHTWIVSNEKRFKRPSADPVFEALGA